MTPCLILTSQLSHDLLTMENNKNQQKSTSECSRMGFTVL